MTIYSRTGAPLRACALAPLHPCTLIKSARVQGCKGAPSTRPRSCLQWAAPRARQWISQKADGALAKVSGKQAYDLIEQGTSRYADLKMAQAAALPILSQALLEAIQEGIANGLLCIEGEDGQRVVRLREPAS